MAMATVVINLHRTSSPAFLLVTGSLPRIQATNAFEISIQAHLNVSPGASRSNVGVGPPPGGAPHHLQSCSACCQHDSLYASICKPWHGLTCQASCTSRTLWKGSRGNPDKKLFAQMEP